MINDDKNWKQSLAIAAIPAAIAPLGGVVQELIKGRTELKKQREQRENKEKGNA